jgi:iron complex outermembrane receptor protein
MKTENGLPAAIANACLIGLSLVTCVLHAATASSSADADANDNQIQEIVVVAQHRNEDMQTVPIAISVFTAQMAQQQGITDPQSLASMVPGLEFNRQGGQSTPFLRGVGSPQANPGMEPSVAFYVDDVYYPYGGASYANFNNLDRVEVEKGPQGTLFGRNATGGVIQVFTKDPSKDPVLDVSVGYANYDTKSGSMYASYGTDVLSANVALYGSDQTGGWGRNTVDGQLAYTGWDFGGRIKFLLTPAEGTSLLLTFDHDSTATAEGGTYRPFPGSLAGLGGVSGYATTCSGCGYYDVNESLQGFVTTRQSGVSLKVTQDWSWSQLVSVTAYRDNHTIGYGDASGSPLPLLNYYNTEAERTITQELRLLSQNTSWLTWIAGLYYYHDIAPSENPLSLFGTLYNPAVNISATQYSDSYSGFGQTTATILPATHLTTGLRYTVDQRSLYSHDFDTGISAPNSGESDRWSKFTYRASLDHQFTPDIMGYVAYNRGFKSGVFNTEVATVGAPLAPAVQPETLDAYTAGAKTEWWDHRVRFNTEGFWYLYKNIQVQELNAQGALLLANAAKATMKGIDLDVQMVPLHNLTVTAAAEVMEGQYDSFPNGPFNIYNGTTGGNITVARDLAGNNTVDTPHFSMSAAVNYLVPLDSHGALAFNVAWSHTSSYFGEPDNGQGQLTPAWDTQNELNLVNASASWTPDNKAFSIELWGKNITGQKYWSYNIESAFATTYSAAPPATYGLTATFHLAPLL